MIAGIFLIIAGFLLVAYPPLLSIIVASVLILGGIGLITLSYQYKKLQKRADNPYFDFFIRF